MTPLPLRVWPPATALAAVLLLAGCNSSSYQVKVDAIAHPAPSAGDPQSYTLKSKNPAMGEENLRYKEAADYVRTALSGKGLYEAPSDDKADLIVELDYGIDAPRMKMERVSVPIYAQVGGGVRYDSVPVKDSKGNTTLRTVAVYEAPRTELIGYDEVPRMVTIYEKHMRVTAVANKDAPEGQPAAQVWSVQVSTEDESKDLRKYLPIMASATADYIGRDLGREAVVKVRDPSPGTEFIRRGMGTPAVATTSEPPKS
jgi:hypothetical protein